MQRSRRGRSCSSRRSRNALADHAHQPALSWNRPCCSRPPGWRRRCDLKAPEVGCRIPALATWRIASISAELASMPSSRNEARRSLVGRDDAVKPLVAELVDGHDLRDEHLLRREPRPVARDERRVLHAAGLAGVVLRVDEREHAVRVGAVPRRFVREVRTGAPRGRGSATSSKLRWRVEDGDAGDRRRSFRASSASWVPRRPQREIIGRPALNVPLDAPPAFDAQSPRPPWSGGADRVGLGHVDRHVVRSEIGVGTPDRCVEGKMRPGGPSGSSRAILGNHWPTMWNRST